MDIYYFRCLLEELDAIGIDQVVFDPYEDEKTLVRGSDKQAGVLVFHVIDEKLSDDAIGVQSVKGLLSRLQLFDHNKASITLETDQGRVYNINIKEGKKKASFRCMDSPDKAPCPSRVPGDLNMDSPFTFSKEYVDYLGKGIAAMGYTGEKEGRNIGISVNADQMTINIFDGDADTFTDVITLDEGSSEEYRGTWDVGSFQRIVRYSVKVSEDETVKFVITEHGLGVFRLDLLNAIAAPVVPR